MNGGYCEEPPFAPPWPKIGVVSSAVVYESMLCAVLINFALYGELIIAHIAESRPYSVFGEGKRLTSPVFDHAGFAIDAEKPIERLLRTVPTFADCVVLGDEACFPSGA